MKKVKLKQKLLWTVAAVLAVAAVILRPVSGMRFSAVLCLCAGLYIALFALLDAFSGESVPAKCAKWVMLIAFCAGLAFFCFLEAKVISGARGDGAAHDVSCVVVLGAGVEGVQPSLMLSRRLDVALAYIADKPEVPVIVSGSQGEGELISEAECMARYLSARGIAEERIWKEERATSTRTNLTESLAVMDERKVDTIAPFAVVTSDYHIARTRYIAGEIGITDTQMLTVPSSLPQGVYYSVLTVNYYIREAFALANEMLLGLDLDL
ncbi:MAG: YdcF family protein [Oscillospiraceae bacterium]|nr:YdcF family protein [Oscillospiraceae bacterium]